MATNDQNITARDGQQVSPWQTEEHASRIQASKEPTVCDTLIVGAGITGLTAALLLQTAGRKTIIAEANTVGFGTTGGTSAHINTFADTTYSEAESAFGEKGASLFADAIRESIALIRSNVQKYHIECDLGSKPGHLYAETEKEAKQLDDIYQGAIKVGVPVKYVDAVPTPVSYIKALEFADQAQFHPLKYIKGLQQAFLNAGGTILEHTRIEELSTGDENITAKSAHGDIIAKKVVYATHLPPNINVFNFECAPYRSYVMAVKLKSGAYPSALIYDSQEPYHYVRTHVINGEELLLVGGSDHKTGHGDPEQAFSDLEKYIREYYDVLTVKYRWSSQYYVPVDGLPYIGQMPLAADGVYCATGYNGNGMMLGTIAGKILSDLIRKRPSPYAELFDPGRVKPIDGFTEFVKENADVAYRFVADRFGLDKTDSLKDLPEGTGKLMEVDGEKIAAYRDGAGRIYALSPVCTHAGCIVNWNGSEKSWDCPCHGARYDIEGKVLTGPATRDLPKIHPQGRS